MIKYIPQSEKGQSLTEFAMTIVLLIILVAGIADGGRALFTYMALRDAAQEGAIFGSTEPGSDSAIRSRVAGVSNFVSSLITDPSTQIQISPAPGSRCLGAEIRVSVSYQFPITMPFLGALIGQQWFPITATIRDTVLRPPCN